LLRVLFSSSSFAHPHGLERLRDSAVRLGCAVLARDHADLATSYAAEQSRTLCAQTDAYILLEPADALSTTEIDILKTRAIPILRYAVDARLETRMLSDLRPLYAAAATESDVRTIPKPPTLYANPPYLLTYTFIGRWQELHELDQWSASGEPALVYEAIGGIGKSALVWEWLTTHAEQRVPDLAGRLWWSFYERGSSLRGFIRQALAYVTDHNLEDFRHMEDREALARLLAALRAKPFLLVLDGFERLLTAYHHLDKAQIRDDRVREDLRESTNPADGDLIRQLADCAPSRILITSRLMPKALEGYGRHYVLPGLTPRDAESLVRAAGIKGSTKSIQDFASQFGCHALVLRVVCGMVNDYAPEPGLFDAWLADPAGGAPLRNSTNHSEVLEFALARLAPLERQLLSRIAVLRDTATYETIQVLSPFAATPELHTALKRLEDWELLQWDRAVNTYDLHPAVRGIAFDQLESADKVGTYKALRDHFAALPPEEVKRATELDHLKNSIEVFRLLVGAGLLKEAASHYFGELGHALQHSIGAYRVICELLRELLKACGPEPWTVLGSKPASYVQSALTIALQQVGEVDEARALEAQSIALDLAGGDWANLAIEIRNISLGGTLDLQERGARLCLALCDATANTDGVAAAELSLAHVAAARGLYEQARDHLSRSKPAPVLEALIEFETKGTLPMLESTQPSIQKDIHILNARHSAETSDWENVLCCADAAIAIVRRTGERSALPFSLRALALAHLGRANEAREALATSSNNLYSAHACFQLGYEAAGKQVLLRAYRQADVWEQERLYTLMAEHGIDPPAAAVTLNESIPHEDEIRSEIARLQQVQSARKQRFLL
jgi:hypothetical protein